MSLFDKIKDILFVDEEELPIITKETQEEVEEEKEVVEEKKVKEPTTIPSRQSYLRRDIEITEPIDLEKEIEEEIKKIEKKPVEAPAISPFLQFDEDEFERINKKITRSEVRKDNTVVKTTTNVKKVETKDYSKYEIKKTVEKSPFRPSPVISPVYGVLDKNYKKTDVVDKVKGPTDLVRDVDVIRKKAFGAFEEIPDLEDQIISEQIIEVVEEKEIPKPIPIEIEQPKVEEKRELTIDEILLGNYNRTEEPKKETPIEENLTEEKLIEDEIDFKSLIKNNLEDEVDLADIIKETAEEAMVEEEPEYKYIDEHTSALEILDEIERELNKQNDKEDLSTEGDLFNLIDTMYDKRKDEE